MVYLVECFVYAGKKSKFCGYWGLRSTNVNYVKVSGSIISLLVFFMKYFYQLLIKG